jgi:hypothetical protein
MATPRSRGSPAPGDRSATNWSASVIDADDRFHESRRLGRTLEINGSRSSGARVSSERRGLRLGRSLLAQSERRPAAALALGSVAERSPAPAGSGDCVVAKAITPGADLGEPKRSRC